MTYNDLISEIEKLKTNVEDLSASHVVLPKGVMQEIDGYNYGLDSVIALLKLLQIKNEVIMNERL